ncbi:LINE-1 reverse transcriptase like, partial [Trifolium medium]|nr:LINE-1 reverse transcriptase like [Trifolium medium]
MGDFNAVREPNERRGVSGVLPSNVEMRDFGGFIEELELVDLPLLGRHFTWFHANGIAMSCIDRILVSSEWLEAWGDCSVWVCSRDVSDHCLLVLKIANNDWGPKPFRFNNNWIDHKHFKKMVEDRWRGMEVSGWMSFVLEEKLRGLKGSLKEWNMVEFGSLESRLKKLVEDIRELDVKGEIMGLDSNEVALRKDVRMRAKRNAILALKVDNMWIEFPFLIREAVVNFFQNHFEAPTTIRPNLDGVSFPLLSEEKNCALTATFSLEEIQKVVMESDRNKSPGPDGFNFTFVKSCWDILKGEIRVMFDQFHGIGKLPKSLLSYFVALIPKVSSPFGLGDFRPISLLGCLYKLIAKVLAGRLAKVMHSLIASTQSAFIKGSNLVDGVLVVNEVVDSAERLGKECLIFKVDFEKAYDSVDWGFLEYMLRRFGFCDVWIGWMRACVFGGNLSMLVNGSPTREINIQRGLKQGDPLAPFLFLLVAKGFGGVMRRAGELNLFKGFKIQNDGPIISHLQYADDTLCIGEASVDNLWTLKAILRGFELASGLK